MYVKSLVLIFLIALMLQILTTPFSPKISSVQADDPTLKEIKSELTSAAGQLTTEKGALQKQEAGATPEQKSDLQAIETAVGDVIKTITDVADKAAIVAEDIAAIVGKLKLMEKIFTTKGAALGAMAVDSLKSLKKTLEQLVNIVKDTIALIKSLFDALAALLRTVTDKISHEGGSVSDNTQKPAFNNTRDNLSGFTTLMLPDELGGGTVSSDVIGGSFIITSYSTADPNVFNVSISSMDIVYDSVTLVGISTGPNHCILDPEQPEFTLVDTTGGIWQANLTIHGFVINNIYTSANPIRYFGVAQGTYDSTTNILDLSISAFDFTPPIVPTSLTVSVHNPTNTPIRGASVSVWTTTDQTLVSTGTTDNTGEVTFPIPEDVYLVTVSASGYRSESSVLLLEGGILDGNMNTPIILSLTVVGGVVVPADKFGLLAPYIGLALAIAIGAIASTFYVKRVKRRKEKQLTQ